MAKRTWWLGVAALWAGAASAQPAADPERDREIAEADRDLATFTSPRLTRFAGEPEFLDYIDAARRAARAHRLWWASRPVQFAGLQTDVEPPLCPPDDPACPDLDDGAQNVVVTGSRISALSNPSITNNQMRGVEEGDIIKQINHFLIVLQDGRLFVVDTRGGGGRDLVLTDRRNVYRKVHDVDWYDEMLVSGDRILVTAYSYQQHATELSVFRLDAQGRLAPEGVFYMSSNDYYSGTNYATRLVDGNLVVYTPLQLSEIGNPRRYPWPVVRRWVEGESRDAAEARGRRLYDAAGIYRPARTVRQPTVHTVSVCPLGPVQTGGELECRATAFVGPSQAQFYVTDDDAYLWTTGGWREFEEEAGAACTSRVGAHPATLYRVPLDGRGPQVLGATGAPIDQFSMEASRGQFRALTVQHRPRCERDADEGRRAQPDPLAYMGVPLTRFSDTLAEAPRSAFTAVPSVGTTAIANRFSDRYLVYGGMSGVDPRDEAHGDGRIRPARAYAVPLDRPWGAQPLDIGHTVIRAERTGNDIVLTGYRDRSGLDISVVDLRSAARIADTIHLNGRYESEGRSHAFNSLVGENGAGMIGLPTTPAQRDAGRWVWRSGASDLNYLTLSAGRRLRDVGRLDASGADKDETYDCEVSCIDWYGNSRPIFTDGRVFGLSGTELIEGELRTGRMRELRRLNITLPPGSSSRTRTAAAAAAAAPQAR